MQSVMQSQIGRKVRQRRWMEGITQQQLGDMIGISPQEVRSYESGKYPISARRIRDIAAALKVPTSYFFNDGAEEAFEACEPRGVIINDTDAMELMRSYYIIPMEMRRYLRQLVCELSTP